MRPPFRRNQFGAGGGPLRRSKRFILGAYEGTYVRKGITQITTISTAAQRSGNFGSTVVNDPLAAFTPFPNHTIPSSRFNPSPRRSSTNTSRNPTPAARFTRSRTTACDQNILVVWTHIFSPRLINEARAGFSSFIQNEFQSRARKTNVVKDVSYVKSARFFDSRRNLLAHGLCHTHRTYTPPSTMAIATSA
ncbi:MAG TPA: hypothetical protein VM120_27480 [Bryobacteraceae bacterium]|nr:hypothetical protein [Bryobacteraceae bacterium]